MDIQFDVAADKERRADAWDALVTWEAQWRRPRGSNGMRSGWGLKGPFGRLIQNELTTRFSGGDEDGSVNGLGSRHLQLLNSLDCSWHVMQRLVDQLAMIHRRPVEIMGVDLGEARSISNLDVVLPQKLAYAIGQASCGVRVRCEEGYAPGLVVVPSCKLSVITRPNNALEPMIVVEHQGGGGA